MIREDRYSTRNLSYALNYLNSFRVVMQESLDSSPTSPTLTLRRQLPIIEPRQYGSSMKARLKDVAERAGVATNTASTILNRRPNSWASKATEARVFKAAKELGYRPSRTALGLRLGSFKAIGLVIPDLYNPFYTSFADKLERCLREYGYDLVVEHSRNDLTYESHCLESILERQVDGVTYFVSDLERHSEFLESAERAGKKVVAMTGPPAEGKVFDFDAIIIDFLPGLTQAIEHLVELGHKRFALLCALAKGQKAGERMEIFQALLKKHGIKQEDSFLITCTHEMENIQESFSNFLTFNKDRLPTALVAMNDLSAISAIRAAEDFGLRVPDDLSVIGMDHIPFGDFLHRKLTTIEQPIGEMAKALATNMLNNLKSKKSMSNKPETRTFKSKLVVKETTSSALPEN